MKEKNNKFLFYLFIIIVISGVIFVSAKEIRPEQTHIEKNITLKK